MAIDPSIISGLKQPQFESPTNALMQLLQVQHLKQGVATGAQEAEEYQRGRQSEQLVSNMLAKQLMPAEVTQGLAAAGFGKQAMAYTKQQGDMASQQANTKKVISDTGKTDHETAVHQFEMAGQLASAWAKDPGVTQQGIRSGLAAAAHSKIISPEIYQAKLTELDAVPQDSKSLNQWAMGTLQQVMKAKESMPFLVPDANTLASNATSIANNKANNARAAADAAATRAQADRHFNVKEAREGTAPKGQVVQGDAGPMIVDPRTGRATPVTMNGAPVAPKGTAQKVQDAHSIGNLLDLAGPLLDTATHSRIGQAYDATLAAAGQSTEGAQAAAQLRALEGALISKVPKMSGPQSDKDVLLYRQMAGQIGDPSVPVETRRAALKTVREITARYSGAPAPAATPPSGKPSLKDIFGK